MKLQSALMFLCVFQSNTQLKSRGFQQMDLSEIVGDMMERRTRSRLFGVYLITQNWTKFLVQFPTRFESIYETELNTFIQ